MTIIIKGANTPLPGGPFRITVAHEARPDTPLVAATAVLLDAAARVRGEADVVHGDRTPHPSGAVRHLGGAAEGGHLVQRLEVDEEAVEAAVQRVLIAVLATGGTFDAVTGLSVEVAGGEGPPVARYEVTDAGGDTALVLGECYRRNGAWRFRAVGQGYSAGPAALAADFGIPAEALPTALLPGSAMAEVHKEAVPPPGVIPGLTMNKTPAATPGVPVSGARVMSLAKAPGPATEVHEGHGKLELTVVNPEPGRPAVVEFERTRAPRPHSWFYIWRLDEQGEVDELSIFSSTRDARGQLLAFAKGEPEVRMRVEGSGDWQLRVCPIDTVETLGKLAEGRGQAVLRYAGPPALIRATCDGSEDISSYVHTIQPDGTSHRVGQIGTRLPMTGPLAVGPEGWCHVVVKLDHAASWKLDVLPLDDVRELGGKLSGHGWELLEMTGSAAKVHVRLARGAESDTIVLATMDAYLRPERQLCRKPGTYLVPPGLIGVRTSEKWSLKVRR
ncbi:TerD family protein [Streptomyces sp. NBC_01240]|uniref:TerD family protein n=1 Tax=Streptomyces sp. NBC_01240 TaxID=2903793 RepID=UPI002E1056D2|nr:TerD family protein [Streptomyces sp. NBC_01240]